MSKEKWGREGQRIVGGCKLHFDFTLNEIGAIGGSEKRRKTSIVPCFYNWGNKAVEMGNNLPTLNNQQSWDMNRSS